MTRAELLAYIDSNVYPNSNNEITALMVRDVLHRMVGFMGDAATYGVGDVAPSDPGLVTGGAVQFAINTALSSAIKFQGVTTTPLTDGSTDPDIVIAGDPYTARRGDEVIYGGREFLWTGSLWQQLGDEQSWALKTITISAGAGLVGGGSLAANRTISLSQATQDSLALANTALQSHQTIYALTIKNSAGTNVLSYTPNSAAGSLTLTKAMVGLGNVDNTAAADYFTVLENSSNQISLTIGGTNKKLTVAYATKASQDSAGNQISTHYLPKATFDDMFEKVALSGGGYAIKAKYGLYTDQFLSAGGLSSGGGTGGIDLDAMWASLTTNTDSHGTNKIHTAHLPTLSVGTGLTASYTQTSATATTLNLGIASGYKLPTITEWGNKADASELGNYLPLAGGTMSNTNLVTNLNADLLDGQHGSYYNNLLAFYDSGATSADSVAYPLSLLNRGTPSSAWWYVTMYYYSTVGSGQASQIATSYNESEPQMYIRQKYNSTWTSWRGLYHSGNLTKSVLTGLLDASGGYYLPLTGGRMSGDITLGDYHKIQFAGDKSTVYGDIHFGGDWWLHFNRYGEDYLIWTAGNDGTGSGLDADLLDGYHASDGNNSPYETIPVITAGGWMDVGKHFEFHYDNTTGSDYSTILQCTGNYGNKVSLPSTTGTLALTTDNVASATQLQTSRSLWGNSFNGTADINGDIVITPHGGVNILGGYLNLRYSSSQGTLSAGMKYDVNGTEALILSAGCSNAAMLFCPGVSLGTATKDSNYVMKLVHGEVIVAGNVGIGTTAPAYKLDVNGPVSCEYIRIPSNAGSWNDAKNSERFRTFYNYTDVPEGSPGVYMSGISFTTTYNAMQFAVSGGYGDDTLYFRKSGDTSPYWGSWRTIWHSGNSNLSTVPWACSTLTASGDIHTDTRLTFNGMNIGWWDGVNNRIESASRPLLITSYNYPIYIGRNGNGNDISIDTSGNVGIGTTSPTQKLHVEGGVYVSKGYRTTTDILGLFKGSDITGGLTANDGALYYYGHTLAVWANSFNVYGNIDVTGTIHSSTGIYSDGYVSAGGLSTSSDSRLKDNIKDFSYNTALLMAIKPREWDWNELTPMKGHAAGFVAQEIEPLLPYAVTERTYKQLYYDMFHALEISGLQDHERRIHELEKAVKARDKKIEELEKRLNRI